MLIWWFGGTFWVYVLAAAGSVFYFSMCATLSGRAYVAEQTQPTQPTASGFAKLVVGLHYVRDTKVLLAAMSLDLFAVLFGGAVALLPIYAKDILRVGPAGLGWLQAAPSLGAISMAMLMNHLPPLKHAGRALLLAVVGFGAATIVFGLSRNFWLSLAMLFLTGACDNISVVIRHTLSTLLTPDEMRGRVSAVNGMFISMSNELGRVESGAVAALTTPVFSVVSGGVGTLVVVTLIAMLSPQLRCHGAMDDGRR
jgi:MFS family permease